jgi:nicotinamidase-related amidase
MKALCVIDVQKDFTSTARRFAIPAEEIDAMIRVANRHINEYKNRGAHVLYIRHICRSWPARMFSRVFTQGLGIEGNPGCELDERLSVASPHVFDKEKPSAFSNPAFAAYLESNGIDELALAGLDGCFCVNATAKDAVVRGLGIELLDDAIVTSFPNRWLNVKEALVRKGASILTGRPRPEPSTADKV